MALSAEQLAWVQEQVQNLPDWTDEQWASIARIMGYEDRGPNTGCRQPVS